MAKSGALSNLVVGLVFLGSLLIVGIVTLRVSGFSLTGKGMTIRIQFDTVSGLQTGDAVRIYGYRVGQVEEIEPLFGERTAPQAMPDRPIQVTVKTQRDVPLTADTQFIIKSAGPLGGNFLEIQPGKGALERETKVFVGTATPQPFEELAEMVRENRQTLHEAIVQIRDSVKAINEREGALGALIRDPRLRDMLTASIGHLENITRAISEGRGTAGKFVMETKMHEDLEDLVARARRVVADLEEGKGTFGALLKDETLSQDLRDAVRDFRDIIAKVNQGEGTAGQLVNNREAWDRLVFVLRQVQEAVEDFREQAPINTFVNAVFSAF